MPQPRILSVDIARGLTVAAMILVNEPGDPRQVYPQLRHAAWNGYTAADLVFPNFLFLSGASLVFSLQSRIVAGRTPRWELARALARRSVNLLLLKLFIAQVPTFRRRRVRIFGVLFRTAICSLLGGLILLRTLRPRTLVLLIASLLALYYALLRIPFGTINRPLLDPDNNLAAALDRRIAHLLHGPLHNVALYNVTHDPEGLLSSIPALATVLLGACAALTMRDTELRPTTKAIRLGVSGVACLVAGHAGHRVFPINKNLWTSSYVLVSGGWSLLMLAALYAAFDIRKPHRVLTLLVRPANILGANAVVAYALSVAVHKDDRSLQIKDGEHHHSLRTTAYRKVFARTHSTPARSLAFALGCAALCFLPSFFLWRKKIFIKI